MRFRKLTVEELEQLEKEYIQFLAANGIPGDEYKKFQLENPEKIDELIEMFSDIVLEQALKKIKYIEFAEPKELRLFHFQEKNITLIGLQTESDEIDFTSEDYFQQLKEVMQSHPESVKIYSTYKPINDNREEELFDYLNQGASVSSPENYQFFKTLVPSN